MLKDKAITGLIFVVAIPILGFGIDTELPVPGYAHVIPLIETKEYYAPLTCEDLLQNEIDKRKIDVSIITPITIEEARKQGYSANQKCVNYGAFTQDGRSISGMFLEKIGLLPPLRSRWNDDGSWNW